MQRRPPTPVCRAFSLCKQIYTDPTTQEHTLASMVHQVFAPEYPVTFDLSAFCRWTNAHGSYQMELQLRTLDGDVVWRHRLERPFEAKDPLLVTMVTLRHERIHFPLPGKYEIALLANEEEVASEAIVAHLVSPQQV